MREGRTALACSLGDGGCGCAVLASDTQRAGSGAIHVLEAPGLARLALGSIRPRVAFVAGAVGLLDAPCTRKGVSRTLAACGLEDLSCLCRVLAPRAQQARR